jgi:hypothetical protein
MAGPHELPDRREWVKGSAKSPDDFDVTDEDDLPMTDEQATRLKALAWQIGVPFDGSLSRGEAERRIDDFRRRI